MRIFKTLLYALLATVAFTVVAMMVGGAWFKDAAVAELPDSLKDPAERSAFEKRLGTKDFWLVQFHYDSFSQRSYYVFAAREEKISRLAERLNMAPLPMHSFSDHQLKRQASDPDWWQPEKELTCCSRYSGPDATRKGYLFIGYNSKIGRAYVVHSQRPMR